MSFGALLLAAAGPSLNRSIDGSTFNFSHSVSDPVNATSGVRINGNGQQVQERDATVYTDRAAWLIGDGDPVDYEAKCDVVSGILDGGNATGSFISCAINSGLGPEWFIQQTSVGSQIAELAITIRHVTNTSDSISFTVNLDGTVS